MRLGEWILHAISFPFCARNTCYADVPWKLHTEQKVIFYKKWQDIKQNELPVVITLDDNEDDRTTIVRSMVKVERA